MKKIIIIGILALLGGAAIVASIYLSGAQKIRLAEINLEQKRIEASLDTQRLVARAYHDAMSLIRRALIIAGIVAIAGMLICYRFFSKMADSVSDMARIAQNVQRIEHHQPRAIDYLEGRAYVGYQNQY